MKNNKVFTTFLVLTAFVLPNANFASAQSYFTQAGIIEAAPTLNPGVGYNSSLNSNFVSGGFNDSMPTVNTGTSSSNTTNSNNSSYNTSIEDILGIDIKSKAERDAEKLAKKNAELEMAEQSRIARNNDGTFAYGYTNGNGAQYATGARYVNARNSGNRMYSAGAGFLPNTAFSWFIAIILIGILVYIVRKIEKHLKEEKELAKKKLATA